MFYHHYVEDAHFATEIIPAHEPIADRVAYLLGDVAARAIVTERRDMTFAFSPDRHDPAYHFVAVELPDPAVEEPAPAIAPFVAMEAPALVAHTDIWQYMFLRPHNPRLALNNGLILAHEFEHITEPEAGLAGDVPETAEYIGMCEERAYGTNEDIFRAIDGSDFDRYWQSLPLEIVATPLPDADTRTDGRTHMFQIENAAECRDVPPPPETFLYDTWAEGYARGEYVISPVNTAICRRIIELTVDFDDHKTHRLIAHVLNGG